MNTSYGLTCEIYSHYHWIHHLLNCSKENPGADINSTSNAAASCAFKNPVPGSGMVVSVQVESASGDVLNLLGLLGVVVVCAEDEKGVATTAKEASVDVDKRKFRRVDMARRVAALRPMRETNIMVFCLSSRWILRSNYRKPTPAGYPAEINSVNT